MRAILLAATCLLSTGPGRNPAFLRATEILVLRAPGQAARVRFQWERVAGAKEYLLRGQWAGDRGWAVRSAEYRVTRGLPTEGNGEVVAFELSLPAGDHSWTVVALRGDPITADYTTPARLSFRLP